MNNEQENGSIKAKRVNPLHIVGWVIFWIFQIIALVLLMEAIRAFWPLTFGDSFSLWFIPPIFMLCVWLCPGLLFLMREYYKERELSKAKQSAFLLFGIAVLTIASFFTLAFLFSNLAWAFGFSAAVAVGVAVGTHYLIANDNPLTRKLLVIAAFITGIAGLGLTVAGLFISPVILGLGLTSLVVTFPTGMVANFRHEAKKDGSIIKHFVSGLLTHLLVVLIIIAFAAAAAANDQPTDDLQKSLFGKKEEEYPIELDDVKRTRLKQQGFGASDFVDEKGNKWERDYSSVIVDQYRKKD